MRGLAWRRAQDERWKRRIQRYFVERWFFTDPVDPRVIGLYARTHTRCSCEMCGNPRKHFKQRTLQEQRAMLKGS